MGENNKYRDDIFQSISAPPERDDVPQLTELRLDKLERMAVTQAIKEAGGNCTRAAELLGVSRSTVHRKLSNYRRVDASPTPTPTPTEIVPAHES